MNLIKRYQQQIEAYYDPKSRPYTSEEDPFFSSSLPSPKTVLVKGLRLIITGEGGSGKTTFLDWTAYYGAKRGWTPIFVSLRNYSSNLTDLINVSITKITQELAISDFVDYDTIAFLLDGYDELSELFKQQLEIEISELSSTYLESAFIVTSRHRFGSKFAHWNTLTIKGLSQEEIRTIILQSARGTEFWSVVRQNPELMEMASKPILLSTMIRATSQGMNFREYFMSQIPLYTAWRGQTKAPIRIKVTNEEIDDVLSRLALNLKIGKKRFLSGAEIQEIALQTGLKAEIAKGIGPILESTNVIEKTAQDQYIFAHASFFESYAGRGLLNILKTEMSVAEQITALLEVKSGVGIIRYFFRLMTNQELTILLSKIPVELFNVLEPYAKEVMSQNTSTSKSQVELEEVAQSATLASAYRKEQNKERKDILVFAIHGFNTRGNWKDDLGYILTRNTDGVRFLSRNWDYGRFVISILNPWARDKQVSKFHDFYNNTLAAYGDGRPEVCVVAHSFGTYIVGHAMRRFPELRFDRILFLGSALPCDFNWHKPVNRIGKFLNIVSKSDFALRLSWFIPGLGGAGKFGFTEKHKWLLQHKEDYSDHSDLFGTGYITKVWIPFLKDGMIPIEES